MSDDRCAGTHLLEAAGPTANGRMEDAHPALDSLPVMLVLGQAERFTEVAYPLAELGRRRDLRA